MEQESKVKLDQTAWACIDAAAELRLKTALGLDRAEWVHDTVTTQSILNETDTVENVANLQFCYALGGHEIEILRYVSGRSWHDEHPLRGQDYYQSHTGFHLDDGEDFPVMKGFPLVQESFTLSHTSDFLTNPQSRGYRRRYQYRIHELAPGTYVKFIKRIEPNG